MGEDRHADHHTDREETVVTLDVPPTYRQDERLDVYLTRCVREASREKVKKSIKSGRVRVNDDVLTKPAYPVQAGDRVVWVIPRPPPLDVHPEPIPLEVVFEDAYLVVVNKPAGMVVHPAYGHRTGTLVHALLHHVGGDALRVDEDEEETDDETVGLSMRNAVPSHPEDAALRPGIVHRLDKDTSGLLVVAKDDVTHAGLARQFEAHTIHRRYLALLWGLPKIPRGTIVTDLGRDLRDRKRMAVVPEGAGKRAVTHYEVLERHAQTALLQFRLETGRTHQIRVHAQHLGHPVFGDPTYGGRAVRADGTRRAFFRNLLDALPRQALHAHTLGFVHPRTGEAVELAAEPPADFQHVLERVRGGG